MGPGLLSFWNHLQLTALRWLTTVLGLVDGLLHVRWGERVLECLSNRWQSQLAQLDHALAALEQERHRLQVQAEALAIHAAVIYLGGRKLACNELRFDPGDPHDEEILDASIDLLVKRRLASVETEAIGDGRYIYHLEPDWAAIHSHLSEATALPDWFREGLRFIDEAFLTGADH
jgi:hypothetical protein